MSAPTIAALVPAETAHHMTLVSSEAMPSVKDRCIKKYGFYDTNLLLTVNKTTGAVAIKPNVFNYRIIIENWKDSELSFDVFEQTELLNGQPLTDIHIKKIRERLIHLLDGAKVHRTDVQDAVELLADAHKYNPLEDWLNSLPPCEHHGYLDRWLAEVCGCPDTEINRTLGRKWLISAVARALSPGCYVEGSLVFFGGQAIGKTWLFQNLNPKPEYYSGEELNISNKKEAAAVCAGKFIIELGELNSIRRNELNGMKQYLTATSDTYQPKYKQKAITVRRMHIFGGSTNEETFLTDPTGNRRFWCVAAGEKINRALFLGMKEQLWAEALAAYRAAKDATEWTLTDQERELLDQSNRQFLEENPLQTYLQVELEQRCGGEQVVTTYRLLNEVLAPYKEKVHPKALASAMQALGWKKTQISSGEHKGAKGYQRPPPTDYIGA